MRDVPNLSVEPDDTPRHLRYAAAIQKLIAERSPGGEQFDITRLIPREELDELWRRSAT
jgi:hypothetical protein